MEWRIERRIEKRIEENREENREENGEDKEKGGGREVPKKWCELSTWKMAESGFFFGSLDVPGPMEMVDSKLDAGSEGAKAAAEIPGRTWS